MAEGSKIVRIAAMADVHYKKVGSQSFQTAYAAAAEAADVLLLCGDLTDYGLPEEAHVVVKELATIRIPIVAVLGNHDFQSGQQDEVKKIMVGAGINVLDGESCEIQGIGFAGAKMACHQDDMSRSSMFLGVLGAQYREKAVACVGENGKFNQWITGEGRCVHYPDNSDFCVPLVSVSYLAEILNTTT